MPNTKSCFYLSSFISLFNRDLARRVIGAAAMLCAFLAANLIAANHAVQADSSTASTWPAGFVSETVVGTGLVLPTAIAFAPNSTLFIAEKRGVVRVWQKGALLPTPFIDLQDEVNDYHDRGLLSLALHPDFPATPYVYLLYVYDPPGVAKDTIGARVSRLLRVTADAGNPNQAAAGVENRVVLLGTNSLLANIGNSTSQEDTANVACGRMPNFVRDCIPADYLTHAIGTVAFGPDGKLYVSNGDGAGYKATDERALRALELNSMAGKIFRLDPVTGKGLSDNPFYDGDPDSNRSKVFNLGLRNPFRFTLHPATGELYTGDVGWDTWEEINVGRGKNFGWPCYEGDGNGSAPQAQYANNGATAARCQALYSEGLSAVQAPAYSYQHGSLSAAAAAGAFSTGALWPAEYRNALFISDYNRNWIKALSFDVRGQATVKDFGAQVADRGGPVQIVFGPDKNLYYVALGAVSEIRRVRFTGNGNQPPIADLTGTPTSGPVPLKVQFSSQGAFDPDGQTLSYAWEFGDGVKSNQPNPEYTYTKAGKYTATLTVTDTQGETASAQLEIVAGNNRPDFFFSSPGPEWTYTADGMIEFSAAATDPDEGDVSYLTQWKVLLHHGEHVHFDVFSYRGSGTQFPAQDHGDNSFYEVCAVAYDSLGASSLGKCMNLRPFKVNYTIDTVPSGLKVNYAGSTYTTPFTIAAITNGVREISVPALQNGYSFVSWTDGGARAHTIKIEDGPRSLTAHFKAAPDAPVTPTNTYLSDLTPSFQLNGWGPFERDRSNGEQGANDGRALTLNGTSYTKGLGVHANSELRYALTGRYTTFLAEIGLDDEVSSYGSVVFQVFADGVLLYESGLLNGDSPTQSINLNVTGKQELRLVVSSAGDNGYDHADWANARLVSAASGTEVNRNISGIGRRAVPK